MQDGSRKKGQGINLATNCFTKQECIFLAKILSSAARKSVLAARRDKFHLKTTIVKTGYPNQWNY